MAEETEALVLELGTNHFGEIAEMVKYFPPETVIITEIAPAHLEGFGSVEGVLRAKLEICGSAKLKKIIFNCDNALLREAMSHNYDNITKIGVGREAGAGILIEECRVTLSEGGPATSVRCREAEREIMLSAPLFGEQHAVQHVLRPRRGGELRRERAGDGARLRRYGAAQRARPLPPHCPRRMGHRRGLQRKPRIDARRDTQRARGGGEPRPAQMRRARRNARTRRERARVAPRDSRSPPPVSIPSCCSETSGRNAERRSRTTLCSALRSTSSSRARWKKARRAASSSSKARTPTALKKL